MSESLRNDGPIWVPRTAGDTRRASDIPNAERDYYLERIYPSSCPKEISIDFIAMLNRDLMRAALI